MATRGGKREGAGRPIASQTLETQNARLYIAERIKEIMPELFDVMFEKARKGDMVAMKELFDRGFGKAAQSMSLDMQGNISVLFDDAFKDSK